MNNLSSVNSFIFNAEIDTNYLQSLYGDDYVYLQEVFATVLNDYESLTDNIEYSFTSGNLTALRAAVHKIKPVFGFVGMTAVQQECQQFENSCGTVTSPDMLARDFEVLKNRIILSRQVLEEEKKKLEIFNSNCS
ncbi:MAG: Hpt domain-containing protein [Bacteroidota bacterium]|nr:Hpt domain-containing protein [Bacteroidota bacterium]MDP4214118.1 Hpt domain-containing protein [Bacteroidota bacterium]MDP4251100.1 Hpt domain-containing protein [Bacteroidota bacterium]